MELALIDVAVDLSREFGGAPDRWPRRCVTLRGPTRAELPSRSGKRLTASLWFTGAMRTASVHTP